MTTKRAILFLLVGYPGSGKTTTSAIIHELTGAVHIWADYERRAMFGTPTHSKKESRQLYDHLNQTVDLLLSDGQSVIFDTNFNFRKDRDLLREIAATHGAETTLVWVKTPRLTARARAMSDKHAIDNKYSDTMKPDDFERITGNLEPPVKDESPIILDGTQIHHAYVAAALNLPLATEKHAKAKHLHQTAQPVATRPKRTGHIKHHLVRLGRKLRPRTGTKTRQQL